jgi:hypothetical protein
MKLRSKVVVGLVAMGLVIASVAVLATARGSGMMGRNSTHMMGAAASCSANSTGTCTMSKAQCSSMSATCPAGKANGTCKMMGNSSSSTCPMAQTGTGV